MARLAALQRREVKSAPENMRKSVSIWCSLYREENHMVGESRPLRIVCPEKGRESGRSGRGLFTAMCQRRHAGKHACPEYESMLSNHLYRESIRAHMFVSEEGPEPQNLFSDGFAIPLPCLLRYAM